MAQSGDQINNGSTSHFYRRIAARCDGLPVGFDVVLPDGSVKHLGAESCDFRVVLHNKRALRALGSLNEVSVAEAYFSGDLDIDGDIFRALSMREVLIDRDFALTIWRNIQPWLFGQSKLNKHTIASHYDHDPEFFSLFLDPEMPIYTQGVFENDDESLAIAAKRKFDYCFAKLRLKPGDHILEVGPGWGAWLKYASDRGVKSTAISISHASLEYLRGMTGPNGYDWELVLADVLEFTSRVKFDAVVMMGIIEHLPAYRQLLAKVASLLKPGGRVYLDGGAARSNRDWSSVIIKHIYPGNHALLVLDKFLGELAKTRLQVEEIINDSYSYHLTFVHWARNLERNRKLAVSQFGERRYRQFLLFLWGFAYTMKANSASCYRIVLNYPAT